ncbi:3'(2'),5'-bisphosphate nucleotidase CysQ [Ferrimonas lipolytica]|uniref:3'(2'),5'-bisphosphate nucleotidase CysQ n=1 Tax=Ferrimonas lipolytica TaxID=2724191 RepID=A0A6H1UKU4_9GAMM|nr:3'(2'),5'-bisphosphate nucleotidase CysQ [Ferrimonas lipolytica]QIZ78422.1 3'(2'),5'-bisphosphate nucleotidase CysQ [Ferrimonas lipolytica]
MSRLQSLLEPVIDIAVIAGNKIRDIYDAGQFEELTKSDNTPVTSADLAAHHYIVDALTLLTPDIPILSEEDANIPLDERVQWQRYWLIDPLDGTQEFIAGSGDFAVNIALIEAGVPAMGVIYAPISEVCYFATRGNGAFKREAGVTKSIHSRVVAANDKLKIAVSRRQRKQSILDRLSDQWQYDLVPFGSASLKSCMVAEGEADCYLRLGPTGEWDTGASQCVVVEAGGIIVDTLYQPLSYNQRESLENPNYMVLGSQQLPWQQVLPPA